jgi:hypothetical protein
MSPGAGAAELAPVIANVDSATNIAIGTYLTMNPPSECSHAASPLWITFVSADDFKSARLNFRHIGERVGPNLRLLHVTPPGPEGPSFFPRGSLLPASGR